MFESIESFKINVECAIIARSSFSRDINKQVLESKLSFYK